MGGKRLAEAELCRLAEDEEIMEAVETLRLWGVNGAIYEKLIDYKRRQTQP